MLDDVLLWGPLLAGAAGLVLLTTYTRGHHGPTAGPDGDRTGAPLDSALRLQCDSLKCGHMQRPHDIAASGRFICRRCGRTYTGR